MSDKKATDHTAINAAFRFRPNRVNWIPTSSPDPVVRRQDRDALNDAIRRAGGHTPPDDDERDTPDDGA